MNFMQALNNTKHVMDENQSTFENDEKFPTTKNPILRFDKNTSTRIVRILPSLSALQGTLSDNEDPLGVQARTMYLRTETENHKPISTTMVLSQFPNPDSPLEQNIARWTDEGKFNGGQFPTRIRTIAYVNAIELHMNPATNALEPVIDQATGQPLIQALQLPVSAYSKILEKLTNPMMIPAGATMSFVGLDIASPVQITKPAKNATEKTYSVDVFPNIALPPLDANYVMGNLEDIKALVVPSEEVTPDWVRKVSSWMDGVSPDGQGDTQAQQPVQQQAPAFQSAPAQQPMSAPAFQPTPTQPQPQAPVAPAFQQTPTPTQPQAPAFQATPEPVQQPVQAPTQPVAPVSQPTQAPVQPASPAVDNDPLAGMPDDLRASLQAAMGNQD